MKTSLEVKGAGLLVEHLVKAASMTEVKKVVLVNTTELAAHMQKLSPVDTGFMRRSIIQAILNAGFTGRVTPTAEYAPYVNFGTRFQAAQPFVTTAFNYQKVKFIADMQKLVD